jgi:hypothetical protein
MGKEQATTDFTDDSPYLLVSIGVIRGQTAFLFLFVSIRVHSWLVSSVM